MASGPGILLIPAAGESARFAAAGHVGPKAALRIDIDGRQQRMIDHILSRTPDGFVPWVVCRREHSAHFHGIHRVELDAPTRGQSETILHGLLEITGQGGPVLVHNCDVLIDDLSFLVRYPQRTIALHKDPGTGPAVYSYADKLHRPSIFREKERISDWAVSGAWYFPESSVLLRALERQLDLTKQTGELYLSGALTGMDFVGRTVLFRDLGTPDAIRRSGGRIVA